MRCFVSVDLPADLEQAVEDVQLELRDTGADLDPVEPGKVHVTLKFLGDVEDSNPEDSPSSRTGEAGSEEVRVGDVEEALEEAVEAVEPFDARFEGLGVFPSRGYIRVVWVGADGGGGFVELAERIEDAAAELGFEREEREFVPHATVARMKSGRGKDRVLDVVDRFEGEGFGTCRVEDVRLKRSVLRPEGAEYSDIAVIRL